MNFFFGNFFLFHFGQKLYIEVTKTYAMVTIKKKFFISFFFSPFTYNKNTKKIYSHLTLTIPTAAFAALFHQPFR